MFKGRCYLVTDDKVNKVVLQTESAHEVSVFLCGKDIREYTTYKAVRIVSAEASATQKILEER